MRKTLKRILPAVLLSLFAKEAYPYRTLRIVGIDSRVWKEITIPDGWIYLDCQDSFIEYPEVIEPTIHYTLHFKDERNHRLELRFRRFKGKLEEYAYLFDMTDFSETYIRIRKREKPE